MWLKIDSDSAVEAVVGRKAWQAELLVNHFRLVIWLAVALAGALSLYIVSGELQALNVAWFALVGAGLSAASHFWILRGPRRPAFSYLISAADYLVALVCIELILRFLVRALDIDMLGHTDALLAFVLLLLALNMLRFNWRVALWSAAWAVVTLVVLILRVGAVEQLGLALAEVLVMGALVVLANLRWEITTRRVVAQQQEAARERTEFLQQVVAGVAHQLNTPAGAIHSNAQLVRGVADRLSSFLADGEAAVVEAREPDLHRRLVRSSRALAQVGETNLAAANRISEVVSELRSFSRLDEAELKPVEINRAIDGAIHLLQTARGGRPEIQRDYGELPLVLCAAAHFNQVMMVLLHNAALAVEGGGGVTVSTRREEGWAVIRVADEGIGLEPGQIQRIFEAGYSRWQSWAGTGLGLSVARGMVEDLGGSLDLRSGGVGTRATVRIPLDPWRWRQAA